MYEFTLEKLRGLMAEKKLKQIDVADALNVSLATINAKLTGKIEFTVKEVRELARVFNVEFIITQTQK